MSAIESVLVENRVFPPSEATMKAAQTFAARHSGVATRGGWPRPTTDMATALAGRRFG